MIYCSCKLYEFNKTHSHWLGLDACNIELTRKVHGHSGWRVVLCRLYPMVTLPKPIRTNGDFVRFTVRFTIIQELVSLTALFTSIK